MTPSRDPDVFTQPQDGSHRNAKRNGSGHRRGPELAALLVHSRQGVIRVQSSVKASCDVSHGHLLAVATERQMRGSTRAPVYDEGDYTLTLAFCGTGR